VREVEVEERGRQGEEEELGASCNIVSVRSWRGVRARGGRSVLKPLHRDTVRDQASNLAMSGVAAGTLRTRQPTKAPRGVTPLILALTAAAIRSVDNRGGRGAQWQPPRTQAIPTSLAGQQCLTNP